SALNSEVLAEAVERTDALASNFKSYMVGKINERKQRSRSCDVVMNQLLCVLTAAEASEFDSLLSGGIEQYPAVECIYVLDQNGVQITDTICNPRMFSPDCRILFHPADKGTDHSLKEYYYVLMDVELQKYTTDPYVSLATGSLCRTISTGFRDAANNKTFVLCIDVRADDAVDLP